MNVEIEAEASQFPEKKYLNGIAVAVYVGQEAGKGQPSSLPDLRGSQG